MTCSRVIVFSREAFNGWRERLPNDVILRGAISIGDPASMPPTAFDRLDCPVLRLEFLDIYDTGGAEGKVGPSSAHILALNDFAQTLRPRIGVTLVHCDAGLSRGPSIAWLLACLLDGPGYEEQHLLSILAQKPGSGLNPWLVSVAQQRFRQFDFVTPATRHACRVTRR